MRNEGNGTQPMVSDGEVVLSEFIECCLSTCFVLVFADRCDFCVRPLLFFFTSHDQIKGADKKLARTKKTTSVCQGLQTPSNGANGRGLKHDQQSWVIRFLDALFKLFWGERKLPWITHGNVVCCDLVPALAICAEGDYPGWCLDGPW